MKDKAYCSVVSVVFFSLAEVVINLSGSCVPGPTSPPANGNISGKVSILSANDRLINTKISIYTSLDDWNAHKFIETSNASSDGSYTMSGIDPGNYYIDAWKDNDVSQTKNNGDFYGVFGSGTYPNYQLKLFSVIDDDTTKIDIQMIIIP